MVMLHITIRKRNINKDDVKFIQASVNENWEKGRTQISKILCQKWNWIQRNGNLKDMACREILVTLERKNLISLPPGLHNGRNQKRNRSIPFIEIDQTPIRARLKDIDHIRIVLVRNTHLELLYNSLVQCHHYRGYKQIVGNHLKYLVLLMLDQWLALAGDLLHGQLKAVIPSSDGTKQQKQGIYIVSLITHVFSSCHGFLSNALPPRYSLLMLKELLMTGITSTTILFTCQKLSSEKIASGELVTKLLTGYTSVKLMERLKKEMIIYFTVISRMFTYIL